MEIVDINSASAEIAKFKPVPVETSAGTVHVRKLSWMDFESVFERIKDTVIAYLSSTRSDSLAQMALEGSWASYALGGAELPNGAKFGAMTPEQAEAASLRFARDRDAAIESQKLSFDGLIQRIAEAPALVIDICAMVTDKSADDLRKLPFDEPLAIFAEALRVNFLQNKRVLDFFGDVQRTFLPNISGSPASAPPAPPGPAPSTSV